MQHAAIFVEIALVHVILFNPLAHFLLHLPPLVLGVEGNPLAEVLEEELALLILPVGVLNVDGVLHDLQTLG